MIEISWTINDDPDEFGTKGADMETGILGGTPDTGNCYEAMSFIRQLIFDATGQECDSGGGLGGCDLWFTFKGQEYFVRIQPSGNAVQEAQRQREAV